MDRLIQILKQELEVYNRFLHLLDDQHKMIISRNLDELNRVNNELDLLSLRAGELEKERIEIVKELSGELSPEKEDVRLADLLPDLDVRLSNRLRMLREAILGAHRMIEEKSMRNKLLIEKSRELIFETMKIISRKPSPVYHKPGPEKAGAYEGSLVNRSV